MRTIAAIIRMIFFLALVSALISSCKVHDGCWKGYEPKLRQPNKIRA